MLAVLVFVLVLLVWPLVVGQNSVVSQKQQQLTHADKVTKQVDRPALAEVGEE